VINEREQLYIIEKKNYGKSNKKLLLTIEEKCRPLGERNISFDCSVALFCAH